MQITYTSKLSESMFQELEQMTQKLRKTKRDIIETALSQYFEQLKRAEYVASFKKAKGDEEMNEMCEMGFDDFLNRLDK